MTHDESSVAAPSPQAQDVLNSCQKAIGYKFSDLKLLRAALTHSSCANTRAASNERMEFLGDSVLGLVVCEELFHRYPDYQEGDLTKIKSAIVSRRSCAAISRKLHLDRFLFIGKGLAQQGEIPENTLADVFEALVAAVFLDGGWEAARAFLRHHLQDIIDEAAKGVGIINAKSELQTLAQRTLRDVPRYCLLDEQGPDHNKCFKVAAAIGSRRFTPAWGRTKKEAEMKAAHNALAELNGEPPPYKVES